MALRCEELDAFIKGFSLIQQCDVICNGVLRIVTPFQYPNGSQIDVFLHDSADLPNDKKTLFRGYLLTDCGQTATYLLDLHIKLWTTNKRRQMVSDICESLGVEERKGELCVGILPDGLKALPDAMVRLAQACIRVADLSFMQRFPVTGVFRDDVEEFIDQIELPYEPDYVIPGRFDKEIVVDFRVQGPRTPSLLKTVSAGNQDSAHELMNEVFSRWYSLSAYRAKNKLITVYDDEKSGVYRPDDMARLREVSDVIAFPSERERLKEALVAA